MIKDGLSATIVNHCHRRLSKALNDAVKRNLIDRNPCTFATTPKIQAKEIHPLDDYQIVDILTEAKESQYHAITYMGLHTGMRRGELCALKWKDIDLDLGAIHVNRALYRRRGIDYISSPKTRWGRRAIALSPQTVLFLKEELQKQFDNRLFYGYRLDQDSPVFRYTYNGEPIQPNALTHTFKRICIVVGLGTTKFHDLRHTHAVMLLKQGVHPKIVQERLGHSSISVTMDIYSHVIPSMQEEAIKNFSIPFEKVG